MGPAIACAPQGLDAARGLLVTLHLRTITLLRAVFNLVEWFGRPSFLRTDNEPAFVSPVFSVALKAIGIRHQRTDPYSPWQNGTKGTFPALFRPEGAC